MLKLLWLHSAGKRGRLETGASAVHDYSFAAVPTVEPPLRLVLVRCQQTPGLTCKDFITAVKPQKLYRTGLNTMHYGFARQEPNFASL